MSLKEAVMPDVGVFWAHVMGILGTTGAGAAAFASGSGLSNCPAEHQDLSSNLWLGNLAQS